MDLPGILTRLRYWALLSVSVLALYVLQPSVRIRFAEFILPTATLALVVVCWWVTRSRAENNIPRRPFSSADLLTFAVLIGLVLLVTLTRYLPQTIRLELGLARPPDPLHVALVLAGVMLGGLGLGWARHHTRLPVLTGVLMCIAALFVVIKTEVLATALSGAWRAQTGQDTALASAADVAGWLGFSYIAFRLIHTLRDRQTGKLPALSLREYVTYVTFFPALIAGPIDRAERFQKDLTALARQPVLDAARWVEGSTRIAVGVFKKFVIADSLALGLALNATNVAQVNDAAGMWLLIYGYALRLFFDFSGYSDIAIGAGILLGIRLPENFDRPYFKSDLASFWQSWHITLSTWARFYVFTPLTRLLLTRQPKPSPVVVVLASQVTTMAVIGLWHGVTANFLIWGLWHGLGLFVHKQWSDRTRKWYLGLKNTPRTKRAWTLLAWFVTFHYVVLGWVWFALPTPAAALQVFSGLLGR